MQTAEAGRFPNPSDVVSVRLVDRAWTTWRRYRPSARNRHDCNSGQRRCPAAFLQVEFDAPLTGPSPSATSATLALGLFTPASR